MRKFVRAIAVFNALLAVVMVATTFTDATRLLRIPAWLEWSRSPYYRIPMALFLLVISVRVWRDPGLLSLRRFRSESRG